jgi:hypothetical protein
MTARNGPPAWPSWSAQPGNIPNMFPGLTRMELRVLGAKPGRGGLAAGDRLFPGRSTENEILALSAEVHDLAQHRLDPEAGEPQLEAGHG